VQQCVVQPLGKSQAAWVAQARHLESSIRIVTELGGTDVRVFGSVARAEDDDQSDVDLLISMPGTGRLWRIAETARAAEIERLRIRVADMVDELDRLLGREVHVAVEGWLPPRQRKHILHEATPL